MLLKTDKFEIGKIVKKYRYRKNLTQNQLAELVDLNEKQIYRIEAGLNYPTYITFVKLVNVLNIDINDFAENVAKKQNPLVDEIIRIVQDSNDYELEIYINVLLSLKKSLQKK